MLIGEITGTVSTSGFHFQAYNDVKKFDFVTTQKDDVWILSQVQEVWKHEDGQTEAEATVIGYREKGMLKRPRQALKPNSMVYLANETIIADTLGLDTEGLYIGNLESHAQLPIKLNPDALYKHMAVLAQTGAGKSYLTAVIIEELLEKDIPVVIIDPHGEYSSLGVFNDAISDKEAEKFGITSQKYPVRELSTDRYINPHAEQLAFSDKNLDPSEIDQLLPTSLNNSQLGLLYTAIKDLPDTYSLNALIETCQQSQSKAKWSLISMLDVLANAGLFSDDPVDLHSLVQPGQATIINLKGVDPDIQEAVVYKLSKELFQLRKQDAIPSMIFTVEESHNYLPERNFGTAICSSMLRTIASEGRKFGFGLQIVSQRPARVDNNVLSQCNSQVIMRLTNPNDLNAVSKSFEGITASVKETISGLPAGVGVVLGKEYPIITEIRARKTQHGGNTNTLSTEEEQGQVVVFPAQLAPEDIGNTVELVYYPLWLVDDGEHYVVIDGKDGSLQYQRPQLSYSERQIYSIAQEQPVSREALLDQLEWSLSDLNAVLERMVENQLLVAEESGDQLYFSVVTAPYERTLENIRPHQAHVLRHTISKDEIAQHKTRYVYENGTVSLAYYPYYAGSEEVYDGITGEAV